MADTADRLTAAIWGLDLDPPDAGRIADAMLAADPHLGPDAEVGALVREADRAWPLGWTIGRYRNPGDEGWHVHAEGDFGEPLGCGHGETLADAIRAALGERP